MDSHAEWRLRTKIKVSGPDSCWLWTGAQNGQGYGLIEVDYKTKRAHRLMYALFHDLDEGDLDVIAHHCDNPTCCNPRHLFHTDHAGNMADAVAKGRRGAGGYLNV